ncbi:hypothetical protein [Acinetobacter pragensis]|uniref:Beta-barrel assembly machine subunit BamE n=1 Tax=Acinetobacter pragensis TaxID=1806892 RepID=A0A151Y0N1_9GAMM|nr:hypothetical protein [Acinetobacter pragensis]KYQ71554.1 hypothetical protein AZH43_13745 [Acinetobacter pragensis]
MYKAFCGIGLAACLIFTSGCSVVMVSKQPTKKNTQMIQQGISRNMVVAEFGAPVTSEYKNGKRYEIYTFTQGYSTASKIGRAFWHGAADVATVGLWELIGTPAETVFNGKKMSYELVFDEKDQLESYQHLIMETPN